MTSIVTEKNVAFIFRCRLSPPFLSIGGLISMGHVTLVVHDNILWDASEGSESPWKGWAPIRWFCWVLRIAQRPWKCSTRKLMTNFRGSSVQAGPFVIMADEKRSEVRSEISVSAGNTKMEHGNRPGPAVCVSLSLQHSLPHFLLDLRS